jgi:hypothetical protein
MKIKSLYAVIILIFGFGSIAKAAFQLPSQLTEKERIRIAEIVALGSSSKLIGKPFSLGGYSGVEISVSQEWLDTEEIGNFGSGSASEEQLSYGLVHLGKGLYNNIDAYVQFLPFSQAGSLSYFGAQARWMIKEAKSVPAYVSFVISANSLGLADQMQTNSVGWDLIFGFSYKDLTLYTGLGLYRSSAEFVGGSDGVTDSGLTVKESVSSQHTVSGFQWQFFKEYFLAAQVDRYQDAVYSLKLGTRF